MLGWTPMATPTGPLLAMFMWLGYINFALAVFNMVPGFPRDRGRLLRAVIWWIAGNARRSTRIAAGVGQAVAIAFIAFGILRFFGGAGLGGAVAGLSRLVLTGCGCSSAAQVEIMEGLRGVRVSDVMSPECSTVDGRMSLQTFADEHLLRTGRRCFIVAENGAIAGLITPHEVKEVARERWPQTTVAEVMRPLPQLRTIQPQTPSLKPLRRWGGRTLTSCRSPRTATSKG
jgi:hypothetical protein